MNPFTGAIAKNVVSNKLSSVSKSLGLDGKNENENEDELSAKELRKIRERETAEKEKREKLHFKRSAEREKKRSEMRAKYGLNKETKDTHSGRSCEYNGGGERNLQSKDPDDGKQCLVM